MLVQFPSPNPEVDLSITYDAVVVGSGAAGGMAVHALTSQGLKVLLLEAGKYQDTSKILHSMEWPYDHPRRGKMPPDYHSLTSNEYTFRNSPYAQNTPYKKVQSYVQGWGGTDYSKTLVVDEKENATLARVMHGSGRALSAVRRICGDASRYAFPIMISKLKTATATGRIGLSPMPTLNRITTR